MSSWYYRPVNSATYPGTAPKDAFLTQIPARRGSRPATLDVRLLGSLRTRDDEKQWVVRMSTPTMASRYKFQCPKMSFSYDKRIQTWDGHIMWGRMDVRRDTQKCMWSRYGTVKHGVQK